MFAPDVTLVINNFRECERYAAVTCLPVPNKTHKSGWKNTLPSTKTLLSYRKTYRKP